MELFLLQNYCNIFHEVCGKELLNFSIWQKWINISADVRHSENEIATSILVVIYSFNFLFKLKITLAKNYSCGLFHNMNIIILKNVAYIAD